MVPEVGVEVAAEMLEITENPIRTYKKYPQPYPHDPGGTPRFSLRSLSRVEVVNPCQPRCARRTLCLRDYHIKCNMRGWTEKP